MKGNFFDTNVLVYVASSDATKADRAEAAMLASALVVEIGVPLLGRLPRRAA
jgi:predicted nucleic acid-binding protein